MLHRAGRWGLYTHRRRTRTHHGWLCACVRTRLSAAFVGFPPLCCWLAPGGRGGNEGDAARLGGFVYVGSACACVIRAEAVTASLNRIMKAMIHSHRAASDVKPATNAFKEEDPTILFVRDITCGLTQT